MKKILLLSAFFSFLLHAASAQTFETQEGDTSRINWTSGNSLKIFNRIRSTSSTPVTVRWRVVNYMLPATWGLRGLCDNLQCRDSIPTLSGQWHASNAYNGGSYDVIFNDFHIELLNMNAAANGTALFRVEVQDVNNSASTKTLTFIAAKGPTGIAGVSRSEDNVVLFPNPARGYVNVLFDAGSGVKNIALYNLIGKPVMVYRVQGASSAKLELDNVASGVYFMRLMDAQGHVVATRRFTHQ